MKLDTIFVRNLRVILENRNIKISHIEKECSLAVGYFADSKAIHRNISLETALKISKILNLSLDDLCNEEFYKQIELNTVERKIKELEEKRRSLLANDKKDE